MVSVHVESYGCSSNQADGEIILGLLKEDGYKIVDSLEKSDLNIICTCVVKTPTSNRMIHRIRELHDFKKPLIVAGCMPKIERDVIEKIAPDASMIGPDSIHKIIDVSKVTLSGKKKVFLEDLRKPKVCMPRVSKSSVIRIIPISIGCLSACSYCCVRFARGKLFCYPPELIMKEIRQSLKEGYKEIWITSQDNGVYEYEKYRLPQLLKKISSIEGKFFVRVGMMNPSHVKSMTEELVDAYKSQKIFKFLHLPVQSGSDKILKRMNRDYTVEDFKNIVKVFKDEFPMLTLSIDVIVGFPEETEKDFQKTIDLIKKVKPDIINVSKFGKRPMTQASKMKQLSRDIIKMRTKNLVKIIEDIKIDNNKKWLNWSGEIIIDEKGSGGMVGRNYAYKPIVVRSGSLGRMKKINVTVSKPNYFIGEK